MHSLSKVYIEATFIWYWKHKLIQRQLTTVLFEDVLYKKITLWLTNRQKQKQKNERQWQQWVRFYYILFSEKAWIKRDGYPIITCNFDIFFLYFIFKHSNSSKYFLDFCITADCKIWKQNIKERILWNHFMQRAYRFYTFYRSPFMLRFITIK